MKKLLALFVILGMFICSTSAFADVSLKDVSDAMSNLSISSVNLAFNADLKVSISIEGMDMSFPVTAKVDMKFADMLANGNMSVNVSGLFDQPIESEFYMAITDNSIDVFAQDENGDWQTTSTDLDTPIDFDALNVPLNFGDKATLEESGDRIVVRDTLGDLMAMNGLTDDDIKELQEYAGDYAELAQEILTFMENTEIVFEFDKDFVPVSVSMNDMDFKANIDGTDMILSGSISCEYSDVNSVDSFEIPEDIIQNAVVFSVDE